MTQMVKGIEVYTSTWVKTRVLLLTNYVQCKRFRNACGLTTIGAFLNSTIEINYCQD